jgi:colanic acid/amylovoran biosynthesis glycosyltransferase
MKPLVASYCTYFLKEEMQHIYRQVTSFSAVDTFVITKFRENSERYPFDDVEIVKNARVSPVRRGILKYMKRVPAVVYRGEMETLRRVLLRRDPALMHIYFGNTGVHLLPLIERWDRPCVVSFHGMDVQRRETERGYEVKLRKLLQTVPLVLVRSRSIAERLIELDCDPKRIRMNRAGIPLGEFPFRQRVPPADGAWLFVQACRLVPKKGLPTALLAFDRFRKTYPKAKFAIAGDGPMRDELTNLVAELGIQSAVSFAGFLSQTELRDLYAKAHVFVHPSELPPDSNQEGVPNSMLEAMATGLPVVATNHGGIPEAVVDRVSGFLVPERDDKRLADAMVKLVSQPDLWLRFSAAASKRVANEFEQRRQVEALEGYYLEAIGSSVGRIALPPPPRLWRTG